ncbi:WYL domain-containing protein [Kocuria sp. CPCC 104605]|uniref:WYL domain-containing protein n=1 Tax=Kocuria subflava TaxID=1736139 RepID=A0A846TYI5_9MICC|nr:WYL domain-containing protein [Kocuria subflava]
MGRAGSDFLSIHGGGVDRREELLDAATSVHSERAEGDGWIQFDVTFEDHRYAVWAIWLLGADAYVLAPQELRSALHDRASQVVAQYDVRPDVRGREPSPTSVDRFPGEGLG